MGSRDFTKADRKARRGRTRSNEYARALDERNKAKETVTDDCHRALALVKAYEGSSQFMLSLQERCQRGGGLFMPTPNQAKIVIEITNSTTRET